MLRRTTLAIEVERVNETDFPDGTRLFLHVRGCNEEFLKDKHGNFIIGEGYWDEETWIPQVFMKSETVKDIRDSLRYWQEYKDTHNRASVAITVTDDPKDTAPGTHIQI